LAGPILIPFSPGKSSVGGENIFPCQSRLPVEKTVDRWPRFLKEIALRALASNPDLLVEEINPYLSIENRGSVLQITDRLTELSRAGDLCAFHNPL
jgi:hypothetical protein